MSQRVYLIAKADRQREKARPYLIAGGGIAATAPAAGLAVRAGTGMEARAAQRDADSAKWLGGKYSRAGGNRSLDLKQGLSRMERTWRYGNAADKFQDEADTLRHASKLAARRTTGAGLLLGSAVAGGGTIGVLGRNAWRAHRDKKATVTKRDSSWKNISQYETERAQGRRTERHGGAVASLGATGALFGGELAAADSNMFGTPFRMKRQLKDLRVDRKARNTQTKEWGHLAGQLYDDPARHAAEMKRLRGVNRAATKGSLKQIARRNPATLVIGGGLAATAGGLGMVGYGRGKARNAEHQIANQRRQRVTKARRNANLTNEELDRRLKRGSAVMRPLGAGAEANPVAGAVEGLLGSERGFRARRNATFEEARGIQTGEQKRRGASLVSTAGGLTAGAALKELRKPATWQDKTKLKAMARNPRAVGGIGVFGASQIYSQRQKRKIGALEDQSWNRLVRENPRTKGH